MRVVLYLVKSRGSSSVYPTAPAHKKIVLGHAQIRTRCTQRMRVLRIFSIVFASWCLKTNGQALG